VAETGVVEVEVTTWSLELRRPSELRPSAAPDLELSLLQAKRPSPELGRFLYTAVGGSWYWIDRLAWSSERWLEWLSRTGVETWVAYQEGTPVGYFELDGSSRSEVEIAYFGLLPDFIGKRLGGWLLTRAIERAWEMGPERVWVHTCSLDGPHALANYQARGMRVFKVETNVQQLPLEAPGPWPGGHSGVSS
jgi:GNAT superfamily N-acetyltransferase